MSTRPVRLTPYVTPEAELHEAVVDALPVLVMPPAEWCCYPAGHIKLFGQAAAKLRRMGLKASWPDFLVLHGKLYGVELKRCGGKLSRTRVVRNRRGTLRVIEGQRDVHPRLQAAGMSISVCESVQEVLTALKGWGVPLRECGQ